MGLEFQMRSFTHEIQVGVGIRGLGMALVVQVVKTHSSWVKDMKIGNLAYLGIPGGVSCWCGAGQSSEFAENKSESSQGSSSRPRPDQGELDKDRPGTGS